MVVLRMGVGLYIMVKLVGCMLDAGCGLCYFCIVACDVRTTTCSCSSIGYKKKKKKDILNIIACDVRPKHVILRMQDIDYFVIIFAPKICNMQYVMSGLHMLC